MVGDVAVKNLNVKEDKNLNVQEAKEILDCDFITKISLLDRKLPQEVLPAASLPQPDLRLCSRQRQN